GSDEFVKEFGVVFDVTRRPLESTRGFLVFAFFELKRAETPRCVEQSGIDAERFLETRLGTVLVAEFEDDQPEIATNLGVVGSDFHRSLELFVCIAKPAGLVICRRELAACG